MILKLMDLKSTKTNTILILILTISELPPANSKEVPNLFGDSDSAEGVSSDEAGKIVFDLSFKYGKHRFRGDAFGPVSVTVEKKENDYVFHRVKRNRSRKKIRANINQIRLAAAWVSHSR
jgi:hypothetical protein